MSHYLCRSVVWVKRRVVMPVSIVLSMSAFFAVPPIFAPRSSRPKLFLGFDRNDYPGDAALPTLLKSFSFAAYWLTPPPGQRANTWSGKRSALVSHGFGFLVLVPGRLVGEIRNEEDADKYGTADSSSAAMHAQNEGFPRGTIIFLDIEEGGRLTPAYHSYLSAWVVGVELSGYRPGFYCSGIPVTEAGGTTVATADDIRQSLSAHVPVFWVYNDVCPPSPGCVVPKRPRSPAASGIPYARVWQFVRSPRDKETSAHCRGYSRNANCYAPADLAHRWHLDLNVATSSDPSSAE